MIELANRQVALDTLLSGYGQTVLSSIEISGLSLDSRDVRPGDAYVALQGTQSHGLEYAESALSKGAAVVLVDEHDEHRAVELLGKNNCVPVPALRSNLGYVASRFFGDPSKEMKLCGITGTDGKTSVCRFVKDSLNCLGITSGYIGTVGWGVGDDLQPNPLTTPDPVTLQSMLSQMYEQGAKYVALEVSSHALVQGRVNGVAFDVAVLTNLGRDHLDYHGDIEAYRSAKKTLFEFDSLQAAVVNADDEFGQQLAEELSLDTIMRFSVLSDDAEVLAKHIEAGEQGLEFVLEDGDFRSEIVSPLLGDFNVENLLSCYAVLRTFGISAADASKSIMSIRPVEGRMEHFRSSEDKNGSINAVVDFAHTPQALEAALKTLGSHCGGQLTVVFGCGGDRDPGKRSQMGEVASRYADRIIVTNDNPRNEKPGDITDAIVAGIVDHSDFEVIEDRTEAIRRALDLANANDWVLVAGKGHEDYQIVGTTKRHFSDRKVVSEWLSDHDRSQEGPDR